MSVRGEVLRGLREVGPFVTYSHVLPFQYTGFIDGQAWGGVGLGSTLIAGDQELADYFKNYLVSMIKMGKHTRNFAPEMVGDDWVPADVSGWFRKVKPQAFAGPCALAWANKQGADIDPKWVPDVTSMAKLYCFIAPIFKFLLSLHWGDKYWFRQHVNPEMFARTGELGVGISHGLGGIVATVQKGSESVSVTTSATYDDVTITEVSAIANCVVHCGGPHNATTGQIFADGELTSKTNLRIHHVGAMGVTGDVYWQVVDFGS